jgi:hypothetical protein
MVGKPGSGKTELLKQLLLNKKLYNNFFNRVYIFSPYEINDLECKLNKNYFNDFNMELIFEIINNLNKDKKN